MTKKTTKRKKKKVTYLLKSFTLKYLENEDEDFTSIKSIVDQKKKEQQEAAEAADLVLAADKGDDTLDINALEWDLKFSALHFAIFYGWIEVVKVLIDAEGI
jgi:septum formation inhibitor MinC